MYELCHCFSYNCFIAVKLAGLCVLLAPDYAMSSTEKQRNKALSLLEHPEESPGLPIRRDIDRRILIFRYPSFEPYFSWSLFYSNKTYWIRRVVWDPSKCFPSENAEPLTFGSEVVCPNEVAETLLSSLATISINSPDRKGRKIVKKAIQT